MGQRKELSQATFSARVWQSDPTGSSRTGSTHSVPFIETRQGLNCWLASGHRLTREEWEP